MKIDKVEVSGIVVLFVGVGLLAFTFFSAYTFLIGQLTILASSDLTELFGRALAPLIEAIIRILFLGIMGWIGSILTIRAVQLVKKEKELVATQPQPQVKTEAKATSPQAADNAPKPNAKPEVKTEPKPEPKPEIKETNKVEEKPQKPEAQPQPPQQPQSTPEPQQDTRPQQAAPAAPATEAPLLAE